MKHRKSASSQLVLLASLLACIPISASPLFPYSWPDYSVVPILFSPTDWDINSSEVQAEAAALKVAMGNVQNFYGGVLGGRTFILNDLEVVQGLNPKEFYGIKWNPGNIYNDGVVEFPGNIEGAVVAELYARGFPTPPAQNESGYAVMIFFKGAGGYAGGRTFSPADGGWAILGDWAIDSIQGQVPLSYWWSGVDKQTGAIAHELGHVFDLPHPANPDDWDTSVMGEFRNYPNTGLNPDEVDRILTNSANFFATPEPASFGLAIAGLFGIATKLLFIQRKRKGGQPQL